MTIERAVKVLKDMVPKTCKMVNGKYVGGFEDTECPQFEAIQLAVEAIQKQIPKKPKRVNKNSVFDGNWKMICPCCGAVLVERITTEDKSYPVRYNVTKHCMCGQALDWSDSE